MAWLMACQSLYTATVTLTAVVDSASKEYARLYNDGLVPPDVATKAALAHAEYRKAAGVAHDAFVAAKTGQVGDTKAALEGARIAAGRFVDVLVPLLTRDKVKSLRANLNRAEAP